jgi:predicted CXXCH cytochrome family protein
MRSVFLVAITMLLAMFDAAPGQGSGSIFETKHNLSVSGRGEITSTSEDRVCIFCHSSHNASKDGPLWNHQTTAPGKFRTYDRSTMNSTPEQPNGSTKLCLSCHDGTIAVGAIRGLRRPISMRGVGSRGEIPAGKRSHIGTDLTGTHPVSTKFGQDLALVDKHLRWPPYDPEQLVGTDAGGYVQCTSCHDPHDDSKSEKYPFWRKATFDEVCVVCHSY